MPSADIAAPSSPSPSSHVEEGNRLAPSPPHPAHKKGPASLWLNRASRAEETPKGTPAGRGVRGGRPGKRCVRGYTVWEPRPNSG